MVTPSLELTEGDFHAYLPERASSNVYSRPRLEFKQRAMNWARGIGERLRDVGLDAQLLGSDEHPSVRNGYRVDCQWVYFVRGESQRAQLELLIEQRVGLVRAVQSIPTRQLHACLALRLDSRQVQVMAKLHPDAYVDFETLRARVSDQARATQIAECIAGLPEQFSFGLVGRESLAVDRITVRELEAAIDQAALSGQAIYAGWNVARDLALEHRLQLSEQLEDALVALVPVYQHFAWRADDDPAAMGEALTKLQTEIRQRSAQHVQQQREHDDREARLRQQQTDASRERTKERVAYDSARGRISLANLFKPLGRDTASVACESASGSRGRDERRSFVDRDSQREARDSGFGMPGAFDVPFDSSDRGDASVASSGHVEAPCDVSSSKAPTTKVSAGRWLLDSLRNRESSRRAEPKASKPKRPTALALATVVGGQVEVGSKVRVLSGPFRGKVGVLGEPDGRGSARVILGLLSTRVLLDQLEAVVETSERPALQSSHRRDGLLGRSGK